MATLLSKTCIPFDIAQCISNIANTIWLTERYERWNNEIVESIIDRRCDTHTIATQLSKTCIPFDITQDIADIANTELYERWNSGSVKSASGRRYDLTKCRRVLELCRRLIHGDEDHMNKSTRWNLEAWISHNQPVPQNMWYEERRLLKDIDHIIQLDGKREWFEAINIAILDIIVPDPPQTIIVGADSDGYKTVQRTSYLSKLGRSKRVLRLLAHGCDWDEVYQERHDRIEERTRVHVLCWVQHLCRTMYEDRNTGFGDTWDKEKPVLTRIYEISRRNDMTFRMFESHALQPPDDKITSTNTYNARRELIRYDELTQLCGMQRLEYDLYD